MYESRKILTMDKLKTRTKLFYWCVIYAPMVSCLHIIIEMDYETLVTNFYTHKLGNGQLAGLGQDKSWPII